MIRPLAPLVHRQRDHQLRLRPGFEPVVVVLARGDDLVDDLAQLVDLDREDPAVRALVALLPDRLAENLVQLDDPVAEQVLEADHHRGLQAHAERLVDHVEHPDAAAVGQRLDVDEPLGIDRKMPGAPALKTVVFLGFGGRPGGCGFAFQCRGGRKWLGLAFAGRETVRCVFLFSKSSTRND